MEVQCEDPHEYILKLKAYSMAAFADRIACPTLVIDSEKDATFPGHARRRYEALRGEKEFMLFTIQDAAEEHCQAGLLCFQTNAYSIGSIRRSKK